MVNGKLVFTLYPQNMGWFLTDISQRYLKLGSIFPGVKHWDTECFASTCDSDHGQSSQTCSSSSTRTDLFLPVCHGEWKITSTGMRQTLPLDVCQNNNKSGRDACLWCCHRNLNTTFVVAFSSACKYNFLGKFTSYWGEEGSGSKRKKVIKVLGQLPS